MSSERLDRIAPVMQTWIDLGTIVGASMMVARKKQDRLPGRAWTD